MALTQVTGPYPIFTDLDGTPLDDGYLYIGDVNDDPETNPIQVYWDSALTIPATQPIRTSNGYAYRNGTPALLYTGGEFSITIRNKRSEFVLYSPVGYGFDPAAVSASVVKNDFVGDGVEVDFTLSASPNTILATNAFINGVYQEKDSYTLSGNTITFSIAPPLNSSIEILTNQTGVINSGNATDITYTLTATGAVQQTVQTKLEQYVSVKDFGAVGDGVTNDRAAINSALAAAKRVYFPAGTYLVSGGSIELPDGVDGISMTGDGVSTKLTGGNSNGVILIQDHDGVYIADMWIESTLAAFGCISSFHQEISDVVIERCKFTTNGAILTNGIKMVMDNSTIGLDGMVIRDCVFNAPGRMGVEIQNNNTGDTVARYRNVTIENCKFLRTGEAVGGGTSAGMGISLTGEGENCEVIGNYFDQCTGPSIEIIGASRSIFSGNFIRRPKARPIQTANTILMTDNIITENVVYEIDATLGDNVFLGSMKNSIITNNYFDLTNKAGVFVELTSATAAGTGKNQFANNTVRTNASYALIVDSTPDNVIEGNILDNSASGSNFATLRCTGASAVRNAVFDNYVAKGTGGSIFDEASSATNNTFANFMSLEGGVVYVRNANGGRNGFSIYDPPSIAAGGVATTTVTVTGANLGDYAEASFSLALGGLITFAAVSAANTVTVTFYNTTGAPIDLGSGVLRARFTPSSA